MQQLAEMRETRPMELHDGVISTTTDVWAMLTAAKNGDLENIRSLASKCKALLWCQYDYTTPMQFAVREGHFDVVRYLIENGALDSEDRNHPFLETLVALAEDRNFVEISDLLRKSAHLSHQRGDTGKIEHGRDKEQKHFQAVVERGNCEEAESILQTRPELVSDELAFWGEGILAVPCNHADRPMIELLMTHGATVPKLSKWGARYYFKHFEIGKFLLDNGMDPEHANWRGFTMLHDMGFTGDVEKARLLLDYGAEINAIDEEYYSTPLGYAAHFGHLHLVELLIERGADPNAAGKSWATPINWAMRKGHVEIANDLTVAGAVD